MSVQQIVAAAVAHVLFNKCWSGLSKYLRFSDDGSVDFDAEGFVAFFEQSEAEVDGEDEDADSADSMVVFHASMMKLHWMLGSKRSARL